MLTFIFWSWSPQPASGRVPELRVVCGSTWAFTLLPDQTMIISRKLINAIIEISISPVEERWKWASLAVAPVLLLAPLKLLLRVASEMSRPRTATKSLNKLPKVGASRLQSLLKVLPFLKEDASLPWIPAKNPLLIGDLCFHYFNASASNIRYQNCIFLKWVVVMHVISQLGWWVRSGIVVLFCKQACNCVMPVRLLSCTCAGHWRPGNSAGNLLKMCACWRWWRQLEFRRQGERLHLFRALNQPRFVGWVVGGQFCICHQLWLDVGVRDLLQSHTKFKDFDLTI